jgi:hypothetical protein
VDFNSTLAETPQAYEQAAEKPSAPFVILSGAKNLSFFSWS